ncbi:swr complex subunit [Entomortierella chlamydospora]|uniref:SWR1-complex protein 4 n=1 Tax=Entomortierella chlamydospora TaxID=101097 RepID=A0A9P6N432_9FUNG|nr:swr complex subunit [Entomortierella chlamydospora]KAG0022831.1 swr complex subunit [Entomortierella chlamydospora]
MATGNDVREIFQLKPSEQVKRVHKTEKKPDGISRELYGLIGNNVSSVAFNNPTYKPKLNVSKKAVNWTWRPFVNPSRDDDLILHHWEKTRTDPNEEYRFYKFNKVINLNEFTPEEYTSHLDDPDWTLEETNYLWDLCRRFDLRWVVIQDRYEWPPREQDRLALTYYNGNAVSKAATGNKDKTSDATDDSTLSAIEPPSTVAIATTTTTIPTITATTTSTAATITPAAVTAEATPLQDNAAVTTTADGSTSTMTQPSLTLVASTNGAVDSNSSSDNNTINNNSNSDNNNDNTNNTNTTNNNVDSNTNTNYINNTNTNNSDNNNNNNSSSSNDNININPPSSEPSSSATTSMEIVSFTPPKTRSMEELKNRYYSINRTLIKIRMSDASQAVEKAQLLSSMAYDKNREIERKKNLEILNTRTPEQIEEEEALYLEARRIDQNEKRITRERENLLRLLNTRDIYGPGGPVSAGLPGQVAGGGGPGTGIIIPSNSITIPSSSPSNNNSANGPLSPSIGKNANGVAVPGSASSNAPVKKRKKAPKGSTQAEEPSSATGAVGSGAASSSASSQTKGSSSGRRPSNGSMNDGSSSNLPQGVQVKKEKLTPGAYLRSQKMTPIVSTKQQRVSATLTQLGLPLKPAMPTATIMSKWDQLSNNIVTLLDLKKQVDKLESDLKVVKMRRGSVTGVGLFPAGGTGSSTTGSVGGASSGTGATGTPLSGIGPDGNFGVKREGTVDELGTPGQVKKKKRKE